MGYLESIIPVSAVIAITIFLIKEISEYIRRKKSSSRKKMSFRKMLARECELNAWVLKCLIDAIKTAEENFREDLGMTFSVLREGRSVPAFRYDYGTAGWGTRALPDVQMSLTEKLMIEVAENDAKLFEKLEIAYDEMINMRHIRQSLIEFIETNDENHKIFFSSFPSYALSELSETEKHIKMLYKECTNEEDLRHRVR